MISEEGSATDERSSVCVCVFNRRHGGASGGSEGRERGFLQGRCPSLKHSLSHPCGWIYPRLFCTLTALTLGVWAWIDSPGLHDHVRGLDFELPPF